jgi:hypothetical protein
MHYCDGDHLYMNYSSGTNNNSLFIFLTFFFCDTNQINNIPVGCIVLQRLSLLKLIRLPLEHMFLLWHYHL